MTMKIIDTLSNIDRKEIQDIAHGVNDAFMRANSHAEKAIACYIEAGSLLSEARQFFPGDKEFGQWRSENTTVSKQWATKLLKVHETYGKNPPKELGISALAELAYAPEATRKAVEEKAADPNQKTPSVRDIKQEVKEEKRKTGAERVEEQLAKRDQHPQSFAKVLSPEEAAQVGIDKPFFERMDDYKIGGQTVDDAYILLGLPPFFDGSPNPDTIIMLFEAMRAQMIKEVYSDHAIEMLDKAYTEIRETLK